MTRSSSKAKAGVFNRQIPMHLVRQFSSEVERLPTVPTQEIEQIRGGGVRPVPMVARNERFSPLNALNALNARLRCWKP